MSAPAERERLTDGRIADRNERAWNTVQLVARYARDTGLQRPERAILNLLAPRLANMRMLDVGVGAGRTALHFAPLVAEYLGIDNAPRMIARCALELAERWPHASFAVHDMRDLSALEEGRFDIVLCSYNGIDYVDHADRMRALAEIRRVSRSKALFCFSSHNTRSIGRLFGWRGPGVHGRSLVAAGARWVGLRIANPRYRTMCARADRLDHVMFNDGAHRFRHLTYYVRPEHQLEQLNACGFGNTRIYSLGSGDEVRADNLADNRESWLYYLCEAV